ncbi:CDP-glycerol glycerophosphotransferase family protein [Sporolactobacillus vineae]|uniref:CDP-glycerol glycerophosphotransferase family protein n=1 Tax=Sporolactobacillus vineae TaxID=444463 RepID=UPI000287F043|nr:CDP-glycerol glycerophosphotransferase family protein [Sporolactobacillus vineae]
MITLYLLAFRFAFLLFRYFPQKNRVVFVVSFSENTRFIADEFRSEHVAVEFVFLCRGKCIDAFKDDRSVVLPFETMNPGALFRSAYYLATAKVVFVDNYFGFLSVVRFREGVPCIQIWHAPGALKTFGLEDNSIAGRSERARRRFRKVYEKFDKVVAGSEIMADIFKRSFGLTDDRILRTGFPRTDFFFQKHEAGRRPSHHFPADRKKILYAPTFRNRQRDRFPLDLDLLKKELGHEYVLLLRLHPAERSGYRFSAEDQSFIIDCSNDSSIDELMLASDLLITDYSSIPVEYSLLGKPMIFYPYDLEAYGKERGFQSDYLKWVPGPVAFTTEELIKVIRQDRFNLSQVKEFAALWNRYSHGDASKKLVDYVVGTYGLTRK